MRFTEGESSLPQFPIITDLPKDHPDRVAVDTTLEVIQRLDGKKNRYTMDRGGTTYIEQLLGMEYLLDYLQTLQGPPVILDIGSGTTRGAHELGLMTNTFGFDMHATVLTPPMPTGKKLLNPEKVRVTSAEYLEGFENNSVRGVLALASIMYSAVPQLAIRRINQILVPGGALKAAFSINDGAVLSDVGKLMHKHDAFTEELKRLGYDIGIDESTDEQFDVVLAIKPGGPPSHSAQEILGADTEFRYDQITRFYNQFRQELQNPSPTI